MTSYKYLYITYYFLRFIMRKLRYELITEPRIYNKIRLCELIHDCASSIDRINELNDFINYSFAEIKVDLFDLSLFSEIAAYSLNKDISRTLYFLKKIDTQTKFFRSNNPEICNVTRRTIENIFSFYAYSYVSENASISGDMDFSTDTVYLVDFEALPWPELPSKPSRDIGLSDLVEQSHDTQISTLNRLHRQIYGIEIPAAEVCSVIPLLFPDLPIELDLSLARQTYDEGRHARILLNYFLLEGGEIEDYTNNFRIWDNVLSGNTLAELLCIEHVLGEGYALGYDLKAIHDYQMNGMNELANIHLELHEDEVMHVSNGLHWFNCLAKNDANEIISKLEAAHAVIPPPDPFFSEDVRRLVGFSEDQIQRQRKFSLKF